MKCPACHEDNDRVIDSRASHDGFATRRRRECTVRASLHDLRADRKRDREVDQEGRLAGAVRPHENQSGLEMACWKRPISDAQLEAIVTEVQNELESQTDLEIESREVGELVMQHLRALDQVAYVRFASVYRQFEDVHDFVHELRPMLAEARRRDESEAEEDDE